MYWVFAALFILYLLVFNKKGGGGRGKGMRMKSFTNNFK